MASGQLSIAGLVIMNLLGLAACSGSANERRSTQRDSVHLAPADSLVATARNGAEIWFTLAREASGSDGTRCTERGIEIPSPVLLNDSTMRALLWNHCTPGDAYLVDLRTGHPVREHGKGKP